MVSAKLLACCVALAVIALVESSPCLPKPKNCKPKHCKPFCPKPCPRPKPIVCEDDYINRYFVEIECTTRSDYEWIIYLMELISSRNDCNEYGTIIDIYGRFEEAYLGFDKCYGPLRGDIFGRVTKIRGKYNPLSLCYTERLVCMRKRARQSIFPFLCKYRNIYFELISQLTDFCGRYNINYQPRPIIKPRLLEYNFISYFPTSTYSTRLSSIHQTCFKDYRYLADWLDKLNCPENGPLYGRKRKIYDQIISCWTDFCNERQSIDIKYYPRFLDCWENQKVVDSIFIEIIDCFRPCQVKFGYRWYELYCQIQDLCNENQFPIIDYIDWDTVSSQTNCRGSYIPSQLLSDYFNNIFVTARMDFSSACRSWKELGCKEGTPEWIRRKEIIDEMRRRLCELERYINRCIRKVLNRFNKEYLNCLVGFDTKYRSVIDEIILDCNKDLWPLLLKFRQQYYINDDCLLPLINQRGITGFSRSMIPCNTPFYDISVYVCDKDIRDLICWFEKCLQQNYFVPVRDFMAIDLQEGCEEYVLRGKGLKNLECIWYDYRTELHSLYRKLIELLCRKKITIGCAEYNREIKCLIESIHPKFVSIIDRFKSGCLEIDGYLNKIYSKQTSCRKSYSFVEASFSLQISASVKVC